MKRLTAKISDIFKKGDMVLLALCVITTLFGIVMIAATTANEGSSRYIIIQTGTLVVGVALYLALTAFDIDILAGQRTLLTLFNYVFIGMLLIWGVTVGGNKSWLSFPFLPFNIQPAEVCKIILVIILAKTMSVHQTRISSPKCVVPMALQTLGLVVFYVAISSDTGVSLIFLFTFFAMAFVGGVSLWWFLAAGGALALVGPYIWRFAIRSDQKNRILALYDPTIDPTGRNQLWQTNQNLKALQNGGLSGQGLSNGNVTNTTLPASHTDSIFSATGEQLGMVGCIILLALLIAIIVRIIYVGIKSPDTMNRLICVGIASMFLFQVLINVGVCLGLIPVIGLALPFFSYGGSSILTSFVAVGIVSGIKMRPAPDTTAHYIRPY